MRSEQLVSDGSRDVRGYQHTQVPLVLDEHVGCCEGGMFERSSLGRANELVAFSVIGDPADVACHAGVVELLEDRGFGM